MVFYKSVLNKFFSPGSTSDSTSPPYHLNHPSRAFSVPYLRSPRTFESNPHRPRVLVRPRPQSSNFSSYDAASRGFFPRSHRNSISTAPTTRRPRTQLFGPSVASLTDHEFVVFRPSVHFQEFPSPSSTNMTPTLQPIVRESSDIDLLLSNDPGDAKKAIIKRLEGLALALEMVDVSSHETKSVISIRELEPHQAVESLSPIEQWEDEDPFASYDEPQPGSSSHPRIPSSSSGWTSTVSSCSSFDSNAEEINPPFIHSLIVAQYPTSFHLEPIPQLTLDICKSTPTPVYLREVKGYVGLQSEENTVISWEDLGEEHPP